MKKENVPCSYQRKLVFNGNSCSPLSPIKKKARKKSTNTQIMVPEKKSSKKLTFVSEKDQMNIILKFLGVPGDEDLSFLTESKKKAFRQTYETYSGKKFSSILPDEDDECIHLIKKMLEFNPYCRYSAEECLNHPYFSKVRNKSHETFCKIKPKIEKDARLTHVIHNFKLNKKNPLLEDLAEL